MIARIWPFSAAFLLACGGATLGTNDGNGTDGGTGSTTGTGSGVCLASCIDGDLSWGPNGGFSDRQPSSRVSTCTDYLHQETSASGDLSCTDTLQKTCGTDGIGAGQLSGAIADDDVKAAFAGTTKLFGADPRGCDGSVMQITYGGKVIEVGEDSCARGSSCGTPSTPCVDIPKGVQALATLLSKLDAQELKSKNCQSVFPGR